MRRAVEKRYRNNCARFTISMIAGAVPVRSVRASTQREKWTEGWGQEMTQHCTQILPATSITRVNSAMISSSFGQVFIR